MTYLRNQLRSRAAAACMAALPAMAAADCTDLRTAIIAPDQLAEIDLIQLGLRTALEDNSTFLTDSTLGSYTRTALVRFCQLFPLPATNDRAQQISGPLNAAQEYGQLATEISDWKITTSDITFANALAPVDDSPYNTAILPLIGPPGATARRLQGDTGADDCSTLNNTTLPETARAGQLVLAGIDPAQWPNAQAICEQIDLADGAANTSALLGSVGYLEAQLPGSINQILAPDFALWLGEAIETRGPRLVGSDDVVVALVTEYRNENRPAAQRDFSAIYQTLPDSCAVTSGDQITDYISFDQAALDGLVAPIDVDALLAVLEGQTFGNAAALTRAVDAAIADQVSACTRDQVRLALTSGENFGQEFLLNAEETANLALVDSFADSAPIVEPFVGLTAQSRSALLTGIRANLQAATQERVQAEVEAAATVLAAAAEPVPDTFDTLPDGVPPFDPLPQNPTIGVTEATDTAIAATVEDAAFRDALLNATYLPAPNAEVLMADARKILAPVAAEKITAIVNRDMVQIQRTVQTAWGLNATLRAAIAAAPAIINPKDVSAADDFADALNDILGVEYPNARLFDAALAQLDPQPGDAALADIRNNAADKADDPSADRNMAIALPDCGCVKRREDNTEIYGFYPFWFAALIDDETSDDMTDDATEATTGRMIDFGIVSRAAFYGLEITVSDGNTLTISNEAQWATGHRDFVNAAHRHRAKADLALQIIGWESWTDVQIQTAVQRIVGLTAPFPRSESSDMRALWAALPTGLDDPQVDGVTLIIDGYDGTQERADYIERLVALVSLLHEELSARGQTINLAFDLNLGATNSQTPIFSDLGALLLGTDPIVDHVLIFLERPTTNSKKTLRGRMENGIFKGIERTRVLRRIIPVLPPGGHEFVLQSTAINDDQASETFSQFSDDLVYFQDNFAGVGFWPTPDPALPETAKINSILQELWLDPALPEFLATFQDEMTQACTFICPNRAYIAALAAIIFLLTAGLIWRSFYSGFVDKLAFKFGLAWLGGALLFAGLMALTVCDHVAIWPPIFLFIMIAGLGLLIAFHIYQGARNGPKP